MSGSIYRDSRSIGRYVDGKVRRLQDAYFSPASSSVARAELARLRHVDNSTRWVPGGEVLFDDLPDLRLTARGEDRMIQAIRVAFGLYAWHQQSRDAPMAYAPQDGGPRRSFGRSCRFAQPKLDEAAGIKRRLAAVETAYGLREMEHHLRLLVKLMRSKNVQVDYFSLAADLYLLQYETARSGVFMRWSRDYYANLDESPANNQ